MLKKCNRTKKAAGVCGMGLLEWKISITAISALCERANVNMHSEVLSGVNQLEKGYINAVYLQTYCCNPKSLSITCRFCATSYFYYLTDVFFYRSKHWVNKKKICQLFVMGCLPESH